MDYTILTEQLRAITDGVKNNVTNMANASALLFDSLSDINWAGFYTAKSDLLELGPFQGKVACTLIPKGKGVCGTAFEREETIVVDNVHEFSGHIACDSASNSEIVIPLFAGGKVFGVLDIDSTLFGRFSDEDREGLEKFARCMEKILV